MRFRIMHTKFIFSIACLILGTSLFFSCEDQGGEEGLLEAVTFAPIEDIVDQELVVTSFAADGSARLPIRTQVPVACTVVYGPTPDFGSLTLDGDMAGGAHTDHNPLLTGLDPHTRYYFRTQGVDQAGTIYLSEVLTFDTPSQDSGETDNLASPARDAVVTGFSSAFGGAGPADPWGAGNAFDDNPNTEWSSDGDGDEAWIEVTLAGRAQVDTISFWTRSMPDDTAITQAFTVTVDHGVTHGPFVVPDTILAHEFEVDWEAQTLRFDLVQTTGGNTGVIDISVLGDFLE
jgi:hypothetical protein